MKWGKKVALLPQPCRLCNTSRNLHTAEAILKSQGLLPGNGAAQHPAHQRGPVGKTQPSQINIAGVISAQLSSVLLPDFFQHGLSSALPGLFLVFDPWHEYLCALLCEHQKHGSGLDLCAYSWRRGCICASWFQVCNTVWAKHLTACNCLRLSTVKRLSCGSDTPQL